jgi:predicted enzyme related to lactoylglutathione lyase
MPTRQSLRRIGQESIPCALIATGAWVYLNANPSIQAVVDRIAGAGGTVTMPPMQVSPEIGYMAGFVDSEGNAMALHANSL